MNFKMKPNNSTSYTDYINKTVDFLNGFNDQNQLSFRTAALDQFKKQGLPDLHHEDWKYTDLGPMQKHDFKLKAYGQNNHDLKNIKTHIDNILKDANQKDLALIVILDGVYSSELSVAIANKNLNITVTSINDYSPKDFNNTDANASDLNPIADFINAAWHGGVVLTITDIDADAGINHDASHNTNISTDIRLLNIYTQQSNNYIINTKNIFNILSNNTINIIEQYVSIAEPDQGLALNANILFELNLNPNSKVTHYMLQEHNEKNYHIAHYIINQNKGSEYVNYNFNIGAKLSRQNIIVNQNDNNTKTVLKGLFMPINTQHMDSHLKVYHNGSYGNSLQDYRGVLADHSRGVLNSLVYVAKDTKANNATQSNKNILLSKTAEVNTKPELQIHSEDVMCAHGATIGQLDDKAIFYLQSRGIPKHHARLILINAFINHVIRDINNEIVINWLKENFTENLIVEVDNI